MTCFNMDMRLLVHLAVLVLGTLATDWERVARDELQHTKSLKLDYGKARNVIFFVGDGMGPATVTAGRTYMAQVEKRDDVTTTLSWEKFPITGLSKVPTSDRRVPDSASTATAMLCGQKTNFYTVGVSDKVKLYDCSNINGPGNRLKSALKHAVDQGKWVGLISNTRITHATPSAAYAHIANRDWETAVPEDQKECEDIASQLVHDEYTKQFRVLLSGGQQQFYPKTSTVPGGGNGMREDNRNLVEEWQQEKRKMGIEDSRARYITNGAQLSNLDPMKTDYLLGLFTPGYMTYELHRNETEPSLSMMVHKALQILKRSPNGFFLFAEGGLIDKAHHVTKAHLALSETVELQNAVHLAVANTDVRDTLTVVTADHSHTMTIGGYPSINASILGTHLDTAHKEPLDGMPYSILGYHNGPGWQKHHLKNGQPINLNVSGIPVPITRRNVSGDNMEAADYVFEAGIPADVETHGGEDVAIYAQGPSAYLFSGVHQQHYIAHALMTAGCLGPYSDDADCPVYRPRRIPRSRYRRLIRH